MRSETSMHHKTNCLVDRSSEVACWDDQKPFQKLSETFYQGENLFFSWFFDFLHDFSWFWAGADRPGLRNMSRVPVGGRIVSRLSLRLNARRGSGRVGGTAAAWILVPVNTGIDPERLRATLGTPGAHRRKILLFVQYFLNPGIIPNEFSGCTLKRKS